MYVSYVCIYIYILTLYLHNGGQKSTTWECSSTWPGDYRRPIPQLIGLMLHRYTNITAILKKPNCTLKISNPIYIYMYTVYS